MNEAQELEELIDKVKCMGDLVTQMQTATSKDCEMYEEEIADLAGTLSRTRFVVAVLAIAVIVMGWG